MHYLIDKKIPLYANPIKFIYKNNTVGILKFCNLLEDLNKIDNLQQQITNNNNVNIFFPIINKFHKFYVESYNSNNGFTLEDIIRLVYKTGVNAGMYDILKNKSHFKTGHDWISQFTITSSDTYLDITSNIVIHENNIYVNVHE